MEGPAELRQRNPRGEGARLRARLVDAAVAVIDEVGDVSRVSVRGIARRASVSPTALYLHFADRDELVDAAIDAGFAAFNDAVRTAAARPAEPREQLRAMGAAYLAFAERQPALYRVIFSARRSANGAGPPRAGARSGGPPAVDRGAGFAELVALIGACVDPAARREAPDMAIGVWSALHGFAGLRQAGGPVPWPAPDAFVRRTLAAFVGPAERSDARRA